MKFDIKIPIYTGTFRIHFVKKLKTVQKKYNLESVSGFDAVFFKLEEKGKTYYVIAFEKNPNFGVIAHEALHTVNELFKDHHIYIDPGNDEPQAYLLQWFIDRIIECQESRKKKK